MPSRSRVFVNKYPPISASASPNSANGTSRREHAKCRFEPSGKDPSSSTNVATTPERNAARRSPGTLNASRTPCTDNVSDKDTLGGPPQPACAEDYRAAHPPSGGAPDGAPNSSPPPSPLAQSRRCRLLAEAFREAKTYVFRSAEIAQIRPNSFTRLKAPKPKSPGPAA